MRKIGISTDPEKSKVLWEKEYCDLHKWEIVGIGMQRRTALKLQEILADLFQCQTINGVIEDKLDGARWSLCYFEHNTES